MQTRRRAEIDNAQKVRTLIRTIDEAYNDLAFIIEADGYKELSESQQAALLEYANAFTKWVLAYAQR